MSVLIVDLDVGYSLSMLLEGAVHDLSLSADSPDTNLTLHATGNEFLAVIGTTEGGYTMVVGIIDGVKELS